MRSTTGDLRGGAIPLSGREPCVYVASPLGFSAATRAYYDNEVLPRLRAAGSVPLDPWADEDGAFAEALGRGQALSHSGARREELARVNALLGARNVQLIEAADAVFAILDGADVDSGTAAEIGFAYALGKPVVGLRTDFRSSGENDGCSVNLQVEFFVRSSGGVIEFDLNDAVAQLARILGRKAVASRTR